MITLADRKLHYSTHEEPEVSIGDFGTEPTSDEEKKECFDGVFVGCGVVTQEETFLRLFGQSFAGGDRELGRPGHS